MKYEDDPLFLPKLPRPWMPSFDSYLLEMCSVFWCVFPSVCPYFYFRILTCQSSGITIQHSTSCLSGTHRPFHGLWNILIWLLASLDWAQGQRADPAFMEGEEATPNLFPLPNSSFFFHWSDTPWFSGSPLVICGSHVLFWSAWDTESLVVAILINYELTVTYFGAFLWK